MVTMRRDVAAVAANGIFDRADRDAGLTDYDIFMRDKMRNEEKRYASRNADTTLHAGSVNEVYGCPYEAKREPEPNNEYADYNEYMRAQLNRRSPEKLLSKEEFYQAKFNSSGVSKAIHQKARKTKKRMTKAGKIFTLVYVLTVIAIASIIIAVNNSGDGKGGVSASADAATGEIKALTVESREIEGNWFDDILDGISNK